MSKELNDNCTFICRYKVIGILRSEYINWYEAEQLAPKKSDLANLPPEIRRYVGNRALKFPEYQIPEELQFVGAEFSINMLTLSSSQGKAWAAFN